MCHDIGEGRNLEYCDRAELPWRIHLAVAFRAEDDGRRGHGAVRED